MVKKVSTSSTIPSWICHERFYPAYDQQMEAAYCLDLGRVLQSSYFRRLQGKSQLWGLQDSDLCRTRMTHSLEVAYIGRQIAKVMEIDSDLIEAICLSHDIGHPPFGHAGAALLDHFAQSHSGGQIRFDENAQNLRVLLHLASSEACPMGLNPTASMIDGLIKYKSLWNHSISCYSQEQEMVSWAAERCGTFEYRNPLASIMEVADDVAYVSHDLDDAIYAGLLHQSDLEQLCNRIKGVAAREVMTTLLAPLLTQSAGQDGAIHFRAQRHRLRYELLKWMIGEIVTISRDPTFRTLFFDPTHHRQTNPYLEQLSTLNEILKEIKFTILHQVIESQEVQSIRFAGLNKMESYLTRLWPLLDRPAHPLYPHALMSLPRPWQEALHACADSSTKLRVVIDYIAGMSDHYLELQASSFYQLSTRTGERR